MQATDTSLEIRDQIHATLQDWRRQTLDTLLRGAVVFGAIALVAGGYEQLSSGHWLEFVLYSAAYVLLVVVALAHQLAYVWRAITLGALLYAVGLLALYDDGLGGDGRVYLLTLPVITTVLLGFRAGLGTLVLSASTIAVIGWAMSSERLTTRIPVYSSEPSAWASGTAVVILLAIVMMASQRLLTQAQARAMKATLENVELEEARAALQQKTQELEAITANLTARTTELEAAGERQAEINRLLEETVRANQRRIALLRSAAEVSHAVAQIRDLELLLPQVTRLISQEFGFYHVGIFLIDDNGRYAVLRAANSEGGRTMLARKHMLAVGSEGIVGHVTRTGQPRIALDVGTDAVYFDNPDLPNTRSEMAVPLRVGEDIIGALDVQSTQEAAFDQEDIALLTITADQIAVAIENARLFQQSRAALVEAEHAYGRYLRQEWDSFLSQRRKRTPINQPKSVPSEEKA